MKKNHLKIIIILIAITFVALQSCEKKNITDFENTNTQLKNTLADKTSELLSEEDINWILSNDDTEDLEVNKNLYFLSLAIKDIVIEKNYMPEIEKGVKNSQLNFISFNGFISQNEGVENRINKLLKSLDVSAFTGTSKSLNYIEIVNNLHYRGVDYTPVLFIPNSKIADFSLSPVVSPGIQIEDNINKGIHDAIIAWRLNEDNEWEEQYITEDEAMNMKNPVIIVSLSTQEIIQKEKTHKMACYDYYADKNSSVKTLGTSYKTGYFKITERYESSGDSEFNIASMSKDGYGQVQYEHSGHICDVKKKDINKQLSSNHNFGMKPDGYQDFIFNTWENDWYTTNKPLGSLAGWDLLGQMKYSNEWYAFDPTINNENNPWKLPSSGSKYQYSKGYIQTIGTYDNW